MTDKRFTDAEMVEILQKDGSPLSLEAAKIIQRQKAEIERLQEANANTARILNEYLEASGAKQVMAEAKSEAYAEFAERLKEYLTTETTDNVNEPSVSILYYADETIDQVAKELKEGKSNAE